MDDREPKKESCDVMSESEIDEALAQSFPASDPPPWTLGTDSHCHNGKNKAPNGASEED